MTDPKDINDPRRRHVRSSFRLKKRGKKRRKTLALSAYNLFVVPTKFKMQGAKCIADNLPRHAWICQGDLANFHHLFRKRFSEWCMASWWGWDGSTNETIVEVQGSRNAGSKCAAHPRLVTRTLATMAGRTASTYMDEKMVYDERRLTCFMQQMLVAMVHHCLRLAQGWQHFRWLPQQTATCIGFIWDSTTLRRHLTNERLGALMQLACKMLMACFQNHQVTLKEMKSFYGTAQGFTSGTVVGTNAGLHQQGLQGGLQPTQTPRSSPLSGDGLRHGGHRQASSILHGDNSSDERRAFSETGHASHYVLGRVHVPMVRSRGSVSQRNRSQGPFLAGGTQITSHTPRMPCGHEDDDGNHRAGRSSGHNRRPVQHRGGSGLPSDMPHIKKGHCAQRRGSGVSLEDSAIPSEPISIDNTVMEERGLHDAPSSNGRRQRREMSNWCHHAMDRQLVLETCNKMGKDTSHMIDLFSEHSTARFARKVMYRSQMGDAMWRDALSQPLSYRTNTKVQQQDCFWAFPPPKPLPKLLELCKNNDHSNDMMLMMSPAISWKDLGAWVQLTNQLPLTLPPTAAMLQTPEGMRAKKDHAKCIPRSSLIALRTSRRFDNNVFKERQCGLMAAILQPR